MFLRSASAKTDYFNGLLRELLRNHGRIDSKMKGGFGGGFPGAGFGGLPGGGFPGGGKPKDRIKNWSITADERTNQIFVSGLVDKVALVKAAVDRLDVPTVKLPHQEPVFLKTYNVPAGGAEAVAGML